MLEKNNILQLFCAGLYTCSYLSSLIVLFKIYIIIFFCLFFFGLFIYKFKWEYVKFLTMFIFVYVFE